MRRKTTYNTATTMSMASRDPLASQGTRCVGDAGMEGMEVCEVQVNEGDVGSTIRILAYLSKMNDVHTGRVGVSYPGTGVACDRAPETGQLEGGLGRGERKLVFVDVVDSPVVSMWQVRLNACSQSLSVSTK